MKINVTKKKREKKKPKKYTLEGMVETFNRLKKTKIKVGFIEEKIEDYKDGPSVAQVAYWNEFGTEHIPARPFFARGFVQAQKNIPKNFERLIRTVAKGGNEDMELEKMGIAAQKTLQKSLMDMKSPPNSPKTIAKKGSANPLVHTRLMHNSISYVIKRK